MAKRGRRFTFHGAFGTKAAAKRKERQVGGFMQSRTIRGQRRYIVMSDNPTRKIDMLERGKKVVRHTFYGRTRAEAKAMERAHLGADASLRAAVRGRPYRGVKIRAVRANTPRPIKIYDGVMAIVARKGTHSKYPNKVFEHKFRTRPKMYGLPDGSLLVTHRRL